MNFIAPIHRHLLIFVIAVALLGVLTSASPAQTADQQQTRAHALQLMKELRYTDALPLLEKLATETPRDAEVQYYFGFALYAQSKHTDDPTAARTMRARARAAFVKARELGDTSQLVLGMIEGIPEDGGPDVGFSANKRANDLMNEGEKAFSSGLLVGTVLSALGWAASLKHWGCLHGRAERKLNGRSRRRA